MKLCLVGIEPINKCFKMTFCFLCTLYDVGQFSKYIMYFFLSFMFYQCFLQIHPHNNFYDVGLVVKLEIECNVNLGLVSLSFTHTHTHM